MTYEEFLNFVPSKCVYETIYDDSDGRTILVIRLLDAFSMVNKAQRTLVRLTDEEAQQTFARHNCTISTHLAGILARAIARAIEDKLKDENT
jgi:hypothetical protein